EVCGLRPARWFGARRRCAAQQVDDVGEKRGMSRFVTRERVEQLRGPVHGKREDQPIWLGGSERGLGGGGGGAPMTQSQVREASEHVCFDECVRRKTEWRHHTVNVSEDSQRRGGVALGQADCCLREVNGVHPLVSGGV